MVDTQQNQRATWKADGAALLTTLLLPVAFLWPAATGRALLAHQDICFFFEPAMALLRDALRHGRLPLWSPYIFGGYPVAAEGQTAVFYPPALLAAALLPPLSAVNWLILSHLMLMGGSMYLLLRAHRASLLAALWGAFVLCFSGFVFAHTQHTGLLCAFAWLPLVLYLAERGWRRGLLSGAAPAAITWGLCALCGHPQMTFHVTLALALWVVWIARQEARSPGGRRRAFGRAGGFLAAILVLGLGLSAIQVLPTAALARADGYRRPTGLQYATSYSLLPRHLIGLILPNWQGTPADGSYQGEPYYWEYVAYLGILPLIVALVGCGTRRGRPFIALAAAALLLALARGNPLYAALQWAPGFSWFRAPARYLGLFTFAACCLTAQGWDCLAGLSVMRPRALRSAAALLAFGLAALDLLTFDRSLAPLSPAWSCAAQPKIATRLSGDAGWGRVLPVNTLGIDSDWEPPGGWSGNAAGWSIPRAALAANVAQSARLSSVLGYAGFADKQWIDLTGHALAELSRPQGVALLRLLGTRSIVVTTADADSQGRYALDVSVHHLRGSFARAFAVGTAIWAASAEEALDRTAELARDGALGQSVVLEGGGHARSLEGQVRARIAVSELRPEHLSVRASLDRPAVLVVNEHWDSGWSALLDGRSTGLLRADGALMAVVMPAGGHTVEVVYRPRPFLVGRAITAFFVTLLLVSGVQQCLSGRGSSGAS